MADKLTSSVPTILSHESLMLNLSTARAERLRRQARM
jgi:hypothetical protein